MEPGGDSIVLEEEIDPNYEPTEKEVQEYASWLGMDLENEQDLFWIAREGLKAPLPENWKPCKTTDTEEIYYFNFATGQSTWDHPCDDYYRKVYEDHKKKRTKSGRDSQDGDERKKKEKEDVAELLGKKGGKKKKASMPAGKSLAASEPLGPPVLTRGVTPLGGEKKPLPGLSGGGKLSRLSSGGLGSASSLRPVGSLNRLKSESKDDDNAGGTTGSSRNHGDDGSDGDDDDAGERKPSPRATMSKPPLGSLLTKKPLPSASTRSLLSKADSKAELDSAAADFDQKKQRLTEEHAKLLRELEDEHDAKKKAQEKKMQLELDELHEQETSQLKQRKKEFDKKMNDVENQFDKEESNLLRERKDKIKNIESEMEFLLSQKKKELTRELEKELQRVQSRHDTSLQEKKDECDKLEKQLTLKGDALSAACELQRGKRIVESDLQRVQDELRGVRAHFEQMQQELGNERAAAAASARRVDDLEKQLGAEEATSGGGCGDCERNAQRVKEMEIQLEKESHQLRTVQSELEQEREELASTRESTAELQRLVAALQQNQEVAIASDGGAAAETQLAALRRELQTATATHAIVEKELDQWKTKCSDVEQELQQLQSKQRQDIKSLQEHTSADKANNSSSRASSEMADLHDQISVLQKTNTQIKDQLLKESNEKKQLREQLDDALAGDEKKQSQTHEAEQRGRSELEARHRSDVAEKDQQIQELNDAVRNAKLLADHEKRHLGEELAHVASENRQLKAEVQVLKRQIDEQLLATTARTVGDEQQQEEQAAAMAATVTKQKYEIEQLDASLQGAKRDKEELAGRVQQLQLALDEAMQVKYQLELAKDSEASRSKMKDADLDALQLKLRVLQDELDGQVESTRSLAGTEGELKSQLNKLKFKEQAAQDKLAQLEEELHQSETTRQTQQSEIERLTREARVKATQLEEKTNAWRDVQGENDVLNEQLSDTKKQLSDWRTRAQGAASTPQQQSGIGGELAELRVRVSDQDAKVETLTMEKTQLMEKHRQLTQKQLTTETSLRSMEAERDRLADECHSGALEVAKGRDRLEKKTKETEQLKAELFHATSEQELTVMALSKERDEKKDVLTQKNQLEKAKKSVEASMETLATQLHELETTHARVNMETQASHAKLKWLESELENVTRELRTTQDDRDAMATKTKQQATEMAALESRLRLLRNENNEQNARSKLSEDETSRYTELIKRLEAQLDEKEAKVRRETEEKDTLAKQMAIGRSEKDELESDLLAMKRKAESLEAKCKDHESVVSKGDFQLKLRVQQLEAEREGAATGKDRMTQAMKTLEKELLHAKEELGTIKNDLETARGRVKTLTVEKDEMETAMLQIKTTSHGTSSSTGMGRGAGHGISTNSTAADAMLVRLQLADVNKSELEHHLAELATQMELSTRRCALAESRCRDQSVEMETLHVEIASLRSSMAKMHLSALESLPLVERLEYEHRKRALKRDLMAQLRDFQEREEHALLRQKARVRAQHERQVEELSEQLESKKQRRVEYEEQMERQLLEQLRKERDAKAKEMRKQLENELLEEEQALVDQKQRHLQRVAAEMRKDHEQQRERQREQWQAKREEELIAQAQGDGGGHDHTEKNRMSDTGGGGDVSPGQVPRVRSAGRSRHKELPSYQKQASSDASDSSDGSSRSGGAADRQTRQAIKKTGSRPLTSRSKSNTGTRRRRHRHESEIQKWQERIQDEKTLLEKARSLISDQRKQLKNQAEKIKKEKQSWKREYAETTGRSGGRSDGSLFSHRSSILQEMKDMIDSSADGWNRNMEQLRERETWLQKRESKVSKMRRALAALKVRREPTRRSRSRSRSRNQNTVRFGSEDDSEQDEEDNDSDSNQFDSHNDSDAAISKLTRLDGELASDASEFSSEDFHWTSGRHSSEARHPYMAATTTASYRYPLSTAPADTYMPVHRHSDPLILGDPTSRLFRVTPSSQTRVAATAGASYTSRLASRVWPASSGATTASTASSSRAALYRGGSSATAASQSDAAVQRRIARWAQGQETMQHAATKQATWLSGLYQEVKAYGDAKSQAASNAAGPVGQIPQDGA